jgi:hypothetical protein
MADHITLSTDSTAARKNSAVLADELQAKIRRLVDDFARGAINRTQFHELYDRYHRQLRRIMELTATPADLPPMTSEERENTFDIKKRLTARVIGVSIYGNQSGLPIETLGDFAIDPALLVPMLSSYRAATREIFSAGMRSTAMDNNQWLCFVPGNYTTLLALFSVEPSAMQLNSVEAMHRDFENANKVALEKGEVDPLTLAYPFLTFVRKAHYLHRRPGVQPIDTLTDEGDK